MDAHDALSRGPALRAPPAARTLAARMTALTIGNFDGVHLGHQALLDEVRSRAEALGTTPVAMFFEPHPTAVMAPDHAPVILTPEPRRAELLRGYGVEVDVRRFDSAFAEQSPASFAEDVLAGDHAARWVVVGPDFRFGKGRAGDTARLQALGEAHGFGVSIVDPVELDGEVVSSTRARERLAAGEVAEVAALLGRFHDVGGEVVQGDQRGRTIGFPTANLDPRGPLPSDGVYAVLTRIDGTLRAGVANLGVRPTFEAGRSVEVHVLDFEGDLYGQTLRVAFVGRLRDEQRFDGLDALVAQLGRDVEQGRRMLAPLMHDPRTRWI